LLGKREREKEEQVLGMTRMERKVNVFPVYKIRKRRQVKRVEDGKGRIYKESCRIYQDREPFVKRVCRLGEGLVVY
jgi:ribosomal protein L16/L10AE